MYDEKCILIPFSKWVRRGLQSSHFMKWAGLISAVSKFKHVEGELSIDQEVTNTPTFVVTVKGAKLPLNEVSSKVVYEILVNLKYGQAITVPKIVKVVELDNQDEDTQISWETVYKTAHRSIDTGTRAFQFKFLHDILATNYWLCKWKIREDKMCGFCGEREENIGHLFWDCVQVTRFWKYFREHYCTKLEPPEFTKNIVFLGTQDIVLCELTFAAKRHIYKCKFQNVLPSFRSFINKVTFMKQIELQVANNNNTVHLWTDKWGPLC